MVIGMMHYGNTVHIGRGVKISREGTTLYAPLCSSMQRANVAYLGIVKNMEVTCARCKAKAIKFPHLVKDASANAE